MEHGVDASDIAELRLPSAPPSRFHLRAARVFTASPKGTIEDGLISVEDSGIRSVGSAVELPAEKDSAPTYNFPTATVLPGLIDAHCHLTLAGDGRTYEQMAQDPDDMLSLVALRNTHRHMAAGVTTLRDNGGRNRVTFVLREAINRGYFVGPRLLLSGRPLTHSNGHFCWCNGVADGADAIRAAVRKLVAEGADHIKIMASGGATAGNLPYYPSYTIDELRVAVDAAHSLGRLTTAHCRAKQSIAYAIEAGLDCIEHAEFAIPGEATKLGAGVPPRAVMEYDPIIAQKLIQSEAYVSYTFQAGGYDTLARLRAKRESDQLTDEAQYRELESYYKDKMGIFSRLLADGLGPRLVLSSDAGCFDAEFGKPYFGLLLATQAGMTAEQALRAMTTVAALACGISTSVGSIEEGKKADLLVVDGNPLEDLSSIQRVRAVFIGGRLVAPLTSPDPSLQRQPERVSVQ